MPSSGTPDDAQTWGSLVGSAPNGNTSGRQPGIGGFESLPHVLPFWATIQFGHGFDSRCFHLPRLIGS